MAGRDVAALLCDADADELKDTRNAQLTTYVSSLMVLDAVSRIGIDASFCAGHSLGEYTALTATGALGFDDGIRLVSERSAAMHDAGLTQPGTMAAVLGLDDDQVGVACNLADCRRVGRELQRTGSSRHRRLPRRRRPGVGACEGPRREAGHGTPGVRRVPHAVHDRRPRSAPRRDRCRRAPRQRRPRRLERRRQAASPRFRLDQPAVGAAVEPGAMAAESAHPRVGGCHRLRRARTRRRPERHGQTNHVRAGRSRSPHPTISTSCSNGSTPRPPAMSRNSKASTCSRSSDSWSALQPACSPRSTASAKARRIDVGTVIGHVGDAEVRSAFAGLLQSYIAVDTERVTLRQPIAWLRTD